MSRLIKVEFQPEGRIARVEAGRTVMAAARQLGLHLNAPCGGRGVCGNCRVEILKGAAEPTAAERKHLRRDELAAGWRLACQATLPSDAIVAVPEATGASDQKILLDGVAHAVDLAPNVRKLHLVLDRPSLDDGRSDADRVLAACYAAVGGADLDGRLAPALLARLPRRLRDADFDVTAVALGPAITALEPGDTTGRAYGVAVDLGTTTVVGTLFDLVTGRQVAVASRTNPQTAIGDDVVSRIHHASTERGGLRDLQRRAVTCISGIITEACRRARVRRREVYEVTVAGNTTMNHLLLGIDPTHVAQSPYVAALRAGMSRPAAEVGLRLSPGAALYCLPNIAGFVGGDTVGVILATDLEKRNGLRLAVDIGTNGEMVLAKSGDSMPVARRETGDNRPVRSPDFALPDTRSLVACSTAAGPAFEGARITHGMRAAPGAIDSVRAGDDDLVLRTIDNQPARGLCGTGLIEAVATLLALGVIDPTGRIRGPEACGRLPDKVARRLKPNAQGYEVILAHAEIAGVPYDISLTQRDVREVQLAKAAIAAGIRILLGQFGLTAADLDEVLLAGAFGNRICVHCAMAIGLLPDIPQDRVTFVGNAAAEGARMVLLDRSLRDEAERISCATRYLELAGQPAFQDAFAEAMFFPATAAPSG